MLADCGLRVSELCALMPGAIDRTGELPPVRIRAGAQGGQARNISLPHRTLVRLERYEAERAAVTGSQRPGVRLCLRHNAQPLNQPFIDTLLHQLWGTAGFTPPRRAMAHALRHHYRPP